jgi:uncharacterized protein
MTPETSPATLAQYVLWGGLLIGLLFGAVGQMTRFCVRGAIADWVIFRGPTRAVAWFTAIAVGAVCVQWLIAAGLLDGSRTLGWAPRLPWVSMLAGGLLFGFGMVLCGGCPQRSLVKAGSGNLKAVVTLLVVAIAALMTLRGMFASLRVAAFDRWTVELSNPQDLGSLLGPWVGLSPASLRWVLVLMLLGLVGWLALRARRSLDAASLAGGAVVGLLVGAAFYLTGRVGFLAEHPETLEPAWLGTATRRPEGLSFSAPMGHWLDLMTLWTDKGTVLTFGVAVALGVIAGAFTAAKARGDFHLEMFSSPREFGEHLVGGVLMGFGGVTALGCSIGNGVTGLALLSSGAVLAVAGIVAGAWAALAMQSRRALRDDVQASGRPAVAATR